MFEEMLEVVVLGLVEVTNEDTANNTVSVLTYKTQFIYTQGNNNPLWLMKALNPLILLTSLLEACNPRIGGHRLNRMLDF